MRVFGIDPGSRLTGYGVVEKRGAALVHIDNGIIRPSGKEPFPHRLCSIYEEIARLINKFRPDIVAIEDIFVAKNARTSMKLGHVRGVAMLAATISKLQVVEYNPTQIKQALTGTGAADKAQVQKMVKTILRLPDVAAEDASDALAIAICHLHSAKMKEMITT